MNVQKINIEKFRSIDDIEIFFPSNKPLVLFGPNNAGKSNILSAIDRALGERYPSYIDMLESDYYMRDPETYPDSTIEVSFDEPIKYDRKGNQHFKFAVTYKYDGENIIHDEGEQLYLSKEDRKKITGYLVDADRNINYAFNYSSKYSILSKFSHEIHNAFTGEDKKALEDVFNNIKDTFQNNDKYKEFFENFKSSVKNSVKGFVHSLEVDFSAYDPNNYGKTMRVFAKEGDNIRGFEEFGTGEQQVLLMSFIKAYMETFSGEDFVLIIEEPEAHLHPLAQKWLKEYIQELCKSGIQVILSTHSSYFLDADYLEGLVRVFKDNDITKIKQLSLDELCDFCVQSGVPSSSVNKLNVSEFYSNKVISGQLDGMFADKVILVEGATEFYSLPLFFKKQGYTFSENGIEIVNCYGKDSIPLFYRLYSAYGFKCYVLFDLDNDLKSSQKVFSSIFDFSKDKESMKDIVIEDEYAYFNTNYDKYFDDNVYNYKKDIDNLKNLYKVSSKPGLAMLYAKNSYAVPDFIVVLIEKIKNL